MDIKQNIFNESFGDVDLFLEKYPETRDLSNTEIIAIHSYLEIIKKYEICQNIILGNGRSSCMQCLFKIENGKWIIWETDERRGFSLAKEFADIVEACLYLISSQTEDNTYKDIYIELLNTGMSYEEIEEFSKNYNYSINLSRNRIK